MGKHGLTKIDMLEVVIQTGKMVSSEEKLKGYLRYS